MKAEEEPMDLEAILGQVVALLVNFGFTESEARQRINLWKAQQHNLEGHALEAILPALSDDQRALAVLKWAMEGAEITDSLALGDAPGPAP